LWDFFVKDSFVSFDFGFGGSDFFGELFKFSITGVLEFFDGFVSFRLLLFKLVFHFLE
jgi:hypothetical protein